MIALAPVAPARRPVAVATGPLLVTTPMWDTLRSRLAAYSPKTDLGRIVKACFRHLPPALAGELLDRITSSVVVQSALAVVVLRGPTSAHGRPGAREDWGEVSHRVITDAGVGFLVDAWENLLEPETMKYHGLGTGTTAEAANQTALTTELTTQYNPDNTRATGSLTESAANAFQTVGTNTLDASATIQEHGLFSQAATGGGTLFDRSLTGGQALSSGDSLQSTYTVTFSSGG